MELKAGYKQTEVGVIPDDWDVKMLGDYSFVTKLAGFEYTLHFNSYKDKGDIVVIRGTNITHNKIDLNDVKTITRETSNYLQRSKLFKNDLVFAYVGTIGPIFLVEENDRFHLGPNTAKITVNKELDSMFLFHYFTSSFLKKEIIEHTSIGAQPSLSMSKIRIFKIIIPPTKTEQAAIATALSDVDALISALDKLIAKKRLIKQGAMQELLSGKKRLAGFSDEWEVKKLADVANIIMGQSPSSIFYNDKNIGFPLIQGNADIKNRKTIIRFFTSSITKICYENDIIMSVRAPVGEIALATFKACLGRGVCAIRYENKFLYHYLIFIEKDWLKISKGSTFDSVNSTEIRDLELKIPDKKEQTAIAQNLSDMDSDIQALETQRDKTQAIKQGMMQELLTGKTRLISTQPQVSLHDSQ